MNASDMDEMLFQCNKNAIYVLNTNYAYGEFGRLNLFGASSAGNPINSSNGVRSGMLPPPTSPPPSSYPGESLYRNTSTTLASNNITAESPHISSLHSVSSTTTTTTTIPKLFHYSHDEKTTSPQQFSQHQQQKNLSKCKTNSTSTMTSSKKSSNVKSAIIAKKTKFWQYLEEEKWKKTSIENLSTTNCERNSELMKNNNTAAINNNHSNNVNNNTNASSNNSSAINNNNRNKTSNDSSEKSSSELYKEAAQLLGLSCTLCDNCRCIDCQSRYFECDDSDSYSELSFLGDYYETFENQSTHEIQNQNLLNSECRSIQSDNSSVGSVNSKLSESHRDLYLDDNNSNTTRRDITD